MPIRRRSLAVSVPVLFLLLGACVTINVYFPAEKVESVAGEIVEEIRGPKPDVKGPGAKEQSRLDAVSPRRLLSWWQAAAWADEVTSVSNPTIRALKQSLKDRFALMKPYYDQGVLREGDDGYVLLSATSALDLKKKRDIKGLVDAENRDRERLYREVASALKIDPSQTNRVAAIFATEWKASVR